MPDIEPNFGGRKTVKPEEQVEVTQVKAPPVPAIGSALDDLEDLAGGRKADIEYEKPSRRQTRHDLIDYRARVEKGLKPVDIDDVLISGRLTQEVTVHKKLIVVFQDLVYRDKVFNAQYIEHSGMMGRAAALKDSICALAVGIKSVNGIDLPPMLDQSGKRTYELLESRVNFVSERLSNTFIDLLWNNFSWFLERCVEFTVDDLKNG